MKFLDLNFDVFSLVIDELYRIRGRKVVNQFKTEWYEKRPWHRLLISGRRAVHEGRAFLSKTHDLKDIGLINFETKCYICNILLYPLIVHSFEPNHVPIKFGLKAYHTRNKVMAIIHKLCKENCWKGLEEQADQTIIDYLIKKESCRKYY